MADRILLSLLCCLAIAGTLSADVKLPSVISDNMVLQQRAKAPIWGWAEPGERITVKPGWSKGETSAVADATGTWMVRLNTPQAGGPYEITIAGKNAVVLKNILIGEVWVCSGQSNMVMTVKSYYNDGVLNRDQEIAAAKYPQIRLFSVEDQDTPQPAKDCRGHWLECTPETVGGFSAAAYFFGRDIHKELKVPVGLILAAAGSSVIETWCGRELLESDKDYLPVFTYGEGHRMNPAGLYNGMIAPLIPFGIRGVLWYQGESNSVNACVYRKLFPAMIQSWRKAWGQGEFPFYYAQISPWNGYGDKPISAELREAQLRTLQTPNTGMAVTTDMGDVNEIHPLNKQLVGKRLALWALAKTYHREGVEYSGPLYSSMKVEGDKIRLRFDHVGGGLIAKGGGALTEFTIAGADQRFVSAQAVIDGETILVSSPRVNKPVAVRFGWSNTTEPNLYNKADLPASPFRTDDWPMITSDTHWRETLNP